jgi:hypothetical protein
MSPPSNSLVPHWSRRAPLVAFSFVCSRRGRTRPHLRDRQAGTARCFRAYGRRGCVGSLQLPVSSSPAYRPSHPSSSHTRGRQALHHGHARRNAELKSLRLRPRTSCPRQAHTLTASCSETRRIRARVSRMLESRVSDPRTRHRYRHGPHLLCPRLRRTPAVLRERADDQVRL